jgi:hypothetical protein
MIDTKQFELAAQAQALYKRYGKPLESEHWGEYVVIAPDGRTVLAATLPKALAEAAACLGPGTFAFRVGEIAAAGWHV